MEKETKVIVGIVFLFTIITSVFSLFDRLSIIFSTDNLLKGLNFFCMRSYIWIILVGGILVALYRINKKQNQDLSAILQNNTIRITTSILVIIDGMVNIASNLPTRIISIKSSLAFSKQSDLNIKGIVTNSIVINAISLVIVIVQILLGIYLLIYYERQNR